MSDPFLPLLFITVTLLIVGGGVGFYADHMRRKYEALEEKERDIPPAPAHR